MGGGQMNAGTRAADAQGLAPVVDAFFSGTAEARAAATVELRNLSGMPLGWKRSSHESILTVRGDGALELRRRADFGERGEEPPGLWTGTCPAGEVEDIWRALRNLTQDSFPGRPADPGETAFELQIQAGGRVARLSWGPALPGIACPGEDAILPLRMLENSAMQETVWEVRASLGDMASAPQGLALSLILSNQGRMPIPLVLAPPGRGVEFLFKFAEDEEEDDPDITPLPVTWNRQVLQPVQEPVPRLAELEAGGTLDLPLEAPLRLSPGKRYLGQISYSQIELGERVAGIPVFAGTTYTDIFTFVAPGT